MASVAGDGSRRPAARWIARSGEQARRAGLGVRVVVAVVRRRRSGAGSTTSATLPVRSAWPPLPDRPQVTSSRRLLPQRLRQVAGVEAAILSTSAGRLRNAMPSRREQDGKEERPEHRFGLACVLAHAHQRQLNEWMIDERAGAVAHGA